MVLNITDICWMGIPNMVICSVVAHYHTYQANSIIGMIVYGFYYFYFYDRWPDSFVRDSYCAVEIKQYQTANYSVVCKLTLPQHCYYQSCSFSCFCFTALFSTHILLKNNI